MQDDPRTSFETQRPKMGVVESEFITHRQGLLQEPQEVSSRVAEMIRFDSSRLAEVTKKIVNQFGTHEFNVIDTVVSLDARREDLDPRSSLDIDRADETDIRNLIPVGEHEQYIDAISRKDDVAPVLEPVLNDIEKTELIMRNLRQDVDDQFALAA